MGGFFSRPVASAASTGDTAPRGKLIGEGACGVVILIDEHTVKKIYNHTTGVEYEYLIPNYRQIIAEGERDAWNIFYERYMPKYATARIGEDGHLLLPKIPGVPANHFEVESEYLVEFHRMVSDIMRDATGRAMSDQKSCDVLVSHDGASELLLPVDFGEFGMYRLMDQVHEAMGFTAPKLR